MARKPEPWGVKQRRGFWYYKLAGDPSYRSTGIAVGNWKRTKPHAERFAQDQAATGPRAGQYATLEAYAAPYFIPGSCPWFAREHGRGNTVQDHYRDQHRARLEIHILPQFGRVAPGDLSPVAIERWLYGLDYASQTKKHILEAFRIVLRDMYRERLIRFTPDDITPPVVRHAETATFTDDELATIFPSDMAAFRELWGRRFPLGVLLAVAYSTGMRTGEIRGLQWPAIHADRGGLVVVATINRDGVPAIPKAKSVRAIPVPVWSLALLDSWRAVAAASEAGAGYVFPGRGDRHPWVDSGAAAHTLEVMRDRLGLSHVTPHGLRHGYNTRMRGLLAGAGFDPYFDRANGFRMTSDATDAVLRAFTGHRSPRMTDLYDHPELLGQLDFYKKHFLTLVNSFWAFRDEEENRREIRQGGHNGT